MSGFDSLLTGLIGAFTAAAPTGVEVWDGEPYDPQGDFLAVGWDRTGQPAVALGSRTGDYGNAVDSDVYEVSSVLSCSAGNETPQQLRTLIDGTFTAFREALRANPTLSGAVMFARITTADFWLDQAPENNVAEIRFTTNCRVGA